MTNRGGPQEPEKLVFDDQQSVYHERREMQIKGNVNIRSMHTHAMLFEKYGVRVTRRQAAEILHIGVDVLREEDVSNFVTVPYYIDHGEQWVDIRDVVQSLDLGRERARYLAENVIERRSNGMNAI